MGWLSSSAKASEVWICRGASSAAWTNIIKSTYGFPTDKVQYFSVDECWANERRAKAQYDELNSRWKPEIDVDCWVLQRLARAWHLVVSPYLVVWCGPDGDKVIAYNSNGKEVQTLLGNKEWAKL
jgi:hypothetical protein